MRSLLLASFLLATAASQAASLNITGMALTNTGTLALSGVTGMADGTYYAGPFTASLDGGASMRVFCGDLLNHTQFSSPTNATLKDTHALGGGYAQAARLLNKYGAAAGDDPMLNAALQGAVWKSIFPTLSYADGTAGASALTTSYLSENLSAYSDRATFYDFGGANQSMIGYSQPVPEPTSVAALGVGALGLLRRRRKG